MIPFGDSSRREWLDTNGLGGYASSTICGMNTRRYHGLLVAATRPPVGRMVLLSKVEETLVVNGKRFELSTNRYPDVVHPNGCELLVEFRLDPFPVFVYEMPGLRFEKSVFMASGENTTVIQYKLIGEANGCALELRPLIAFRDYHQTTHQNAALNPSLEIGAGVVKMAPYPGVPPMFLMHGSGDLQKTGEWYRNFEYDRERERGLDYREELFQPFTLTFDLSRNSEPAIVATTDAGMKSAQHIRQSEIERRKFASGLARAADQFIVKRGDGNTVIAGYHWFTDWGRDTMISLPGLTLSTGRPEVAAKILLAFSGSVDQGMLPNRFPDAGETPEYNTVDATLWFFEAIRAYLAHTGDLELIRSSLYPVLKDIVRWHERGTRYGIRVDDDGLLTAGEPGTQLTWMDVKIGDWVVTPRQGKPVEIQALWYNALRVMEDLAGVLGDAQAASHYRDSADRARASFIKLFWNESAACLYDVIDGDARDASLRPNQIFAVSLFHTMLSPERAAQVVATVQQHLLTPFGLRTLAPADARYRGRYEGDAQSRDSAYHQGTVWPWLMGPFLIAWLRVNGHSRDQARIWIQHLKSYMENEGCGQLPEVFDGDAPHRPGGCIAQAWSVAELLRVCPKVQAR